MNEYLLQYPVNVINIRTEFSKSHKGLDLGWDSNYKNGSKNQKIYAAADGEVVYLKYQVTGGYVLGIYHKQFNFTSEYGHLKKGSIKVKIGDKVKRGQEIALMGATGLVVGNHLHFGLCVGSNLNYSNGVWLDPLKYLVRLKKQTISGYSKDKLKIVQTLLVHDVPSEPLLIHNKMNYLNSSIVKCLGLHNGDECPNYGTDKSFLICDLRNRYYTAKKYVIK